MQNLKPGFRKNNIEDFNKLLKKVDCDGNTDIKRVVNVIIILLNTDAFELMRCIPKRTKITKLEKSLSLLPALF